MATLVELCESGVLDVIDPLEAGELPWRSLYGTADFLVWLENVLPTLPHNPLYTDLTPQEQLYALFSEFVMGEEFIIDRRFKKLKCTPDHHVWELKTDEIRIFGWFPRKDCFICCFGDSKDSIMAMSSYGTHIARTVHVRNNIQLDEPKFLTAAGHNDVLSNKA